MSKRPSLDSLIYLINYIMENEKCTVDIAMSRAKVPPEMIPWVESYFSKSFQIESPAVLSSNDFQGIIFCEDPENGNPEVFLSSFRDFLQKNRGWIPATVESLDTNTSSIIRKLPDPRKQDIFATRGLVIGHIQSGKTANMASLIAKAADRGYKFFIILAGLYNDLRAQTQKRIDQEITGKSDIEADYPCVERNVTAPSCVRLTQSGLTGDFKSTHISDLNPETLKFAVVKKNVRVLTSLVEWLKKSSISLSELPALIIDDEADQATINSNYGKRDDEGNEIDPSATNRKIRELVHLFPKCSYIGFTATPFANLLVDKDIAEDLYPKDFIISLPEPPSYLGPRQLFGLGMTATELSPENIEIPNLDVIREIPDDELHLLGTLEPTSDMPEILETAIISFLLASCARIERGQENQHFSMFIHPSYISSRQETMKSVIQRYVDTNLKAFVIGGESRYKVFHKKAKDLWEKDFCKVTKDISGAKNLIADFDVVWRHASKIVASIEVKSLNYLSEDFIDFNPNHPRRYIVVGGNRLSRGLTIEGLSTSVFLRDTPYYDTLLQMGRWFGYRPNYADLTRIFVEDSIANNFSDLARIELELREDIKKYSLDKPTLTPKQLAPVIRNHHDMYVTARGKMGAGKSVTPYMSGKIKQTVTFPTDNILAIKNNLKISREFIASLGAPSNSQDDYNAWSNVQAAKVVKFINDYQFGDALEINSAALMSFITKMNQFNELRNWDIVIPAGSKDIFTWTHKIQSKTVHRSPVTKKSIGVLSSSTDIHKWKQLLGRDGKDPDVGCLLLYPIDGSKTNSSGTTSFFSGNEKPEIIGLVMVFPNSSKFSPASYISQDFQ